MATAQLNPCAVGALPSWLPASLENHPAVPLAVNLARIIGCSPTGAGLLLAFRRILMCIDQVGLRLQPRNLEGYRNALASIVEAMTTAEDLPARVRARPDIAAERLSYQIWLCPADRGSSAILARVNELAGLLILSHIARDCDLSESRAEVCTKLIRSVGSKDGRSYRWTLFLEGDAFDILHLSRSLPDCGGLKTLEDFVQYMEAAAADLVALPVLAPADKSRYANTRTPDTVGASQDTPHEVLAVSPPANDEPRIGSLVRWQFARAAKASGPQCCGLADWDVMNPDELKQTTRRLARFLSRSDNIQEFKLATLAVLSLVSSLPERLLLELPLRDNGDVWLDPAKGCICWARTQLVSQQTDDPTVLSAGYRPSQVLHVYLPWTVGAFLQRSDHGEARSVKELVFGADAPLTDIIDAYRAFVREDVSTDITRKAYSARFSYSFGAAILHATNNQVLAGVIAQDFRLLAPAEIDYLCLSERAIHRALGKTFSFLGLGIPARCQSDGWFGSPVCPRDDVMRKAISELQQDASDAAAAITPNMKLTDYVNHLNSKIRAGAATYVLVTGHRSAMLERSTFGSLYASHEAILVADKETAVSRIRLLPKTDLVDSILEAYRRDLMSLASRLEREYGSTAKQIKRMALLERPNAPAFFNVVLSSEGNASLVPLRTEDIQSALHRHGLARNGGRHFLISQLARRNVSAPLIRSVTGHARGRGHPFHAAAGIAPLDAARMMSSHLTNIHRCTVPWPSVQSSKLPASTVSMKAKAIDALQNGMVVAFNRTNGKSRSESNEVFYPAILAHYELVRRVRESLANGASGLSDGAALLLCLAFVDGIVSPLELKSALNGVDAGTYFNIGRTALITYQTKKSRVVAIPIQPLTAIYLAASRRQVRASFETLRDEAVRWIKKTIESVAFNDDAAMALSELCGVAKSACTLELAPFLATTQSGELDSAAMSIDSISRMIFGRPATPALSMPRRKRRSSRSRSRGDIADLCKRLNAVADTSQQLGEDQQRRQLLKTELQNWWDAVSPTEGARALAEYIEAERVNGGEHGGRLELSSLATYISVVRALVDDYEHVNPIDYPADLWTAGLEAVQRGAEGEKAERLLSIFRRFARYWYWRGADVPIEIFAARSPETADLPQRRASSVFISRDQRIQIRNRLAGAFEPGSLEYATAVCFGALITEHPFRSGEFLPIRFPDFHYDVSQIAIAASGYDHLKNKKPRTLSLSRPLSQALFSLRRRLRDAGETSLFGNAEFLRDLLGDAIAEVTGETGARVHSLRGSAECDMVCPELVELVLALVNNRLSGVQERPPIEQWARIFKAALAAGHHPLTALKYYISTWPILAYDCRRHRQAAVVPRSGLAARIPGVTPENVRQIVSRTQRSGKCHMDYWSQLAAYVQLDGRALENLLAAEDAPSEGTVEAKPRTNEEAELAFLACRLAQLSFNASVDLSGLSPIRAHQLAVYVASLPSKNLLPSPSLRSAIQSEARKFFVGTLSSCRDATALRAALDWIGAASRTTPTPLGDVVVAMSRMRALLPGAMTVAVLPEAASNDVELRMRCLSIDRDVLVKAATVKPADRFRFQVVPRDRERRGPRAQGAMTALFETVVHARLIQLTSKGGWNA